MNQNEEWRESIINEIIERELVMFLATANEDGPASCQQRPDAFRVMRWMAHAVHSDATLQSYLGDLQNAAESGRNFMIEKYARMDNRLAPLSHHPSIPAIADAEAEWLTQAAYRYPLSLRSNAGEMFRRYISCELETLSDTTLNLYFEEVQKALAENRNMVEERHDLLCQRLGYGSLADREEALRNKK